MPRRLGRETVWVIAMTMLGAGVRLKGLGTLGLDHFDEGIYAQAASWVFAEGGLRALDPALIPYAPPGFPFLVGLSYQLVGVSAAAVILVSILTGVLTIPVLAWLARRTFGQGAGAATAALVALSGPHVLFSRTGLTDATFLLVWSLAMLAGVRFLDRPGVRSAIGLGFLVGLAQLVKYNGGMTGLIVALTVLIAAIRPGAGRDALPKSLGFGLLAAAVALLVYLPWFLFVERTTGYAGLLAHHRSYVDGVAGWWPNWQQQMAQAAALVGLTRTGNSWLAISVALAWIGAAIGQGRSVRSWKRFRHLGPLLALILAVVSLASPANLPYWAALIWAPVLVWFDTRPSARLMAVWFLVMAVSTPLYHPYARLWLPTLAASWMLGGGLIAAVLCWLRGVRDEPETIPTRRSLQPLRHVVAIAVVGVLLAEVGPWVLPDRVRWFPDPLAPSDGSRNAAEFLRAELPEAPLGAPASSVLVYARPTVGYHYVLAGGTNPIRVLADLEALRTDSARSGTLALVDAAMGVTMTPEQVLELQDAGWRLTSDQQTSISIASLLDVRPGCVYDPAERFLGTEPPAIPGKAAAEESQDAGVCSFWIFTRR
ncbi:ArnT family glycosyltransferase [Tautonia marina]|uniref:ArnT family glycosyltransferase n=1 Tax=Tautonia marina TaxID=2653855 RepID=UPI001375B541|nr:glycosyltransferase family 39 protein [Tautonia marina]